MEDSCRSFDAGFDDEALRLSVSARVLLHDTNNSHSLLGQMGLLTIDFYSSTTKWDRNNLLPHHGLLQIGLANNSSSYRAPLDDRPPHFFRWVSFDEWWNEIVFDDRKGNSLTRKDIILSLADKEGGAHVDPRLTPSYETIIKLSSFWNVRTSEGEIPLGPRIERLSMRQIAHEILRTNNKAGYFTQQ